MASVAAAEAASQRAPAIVSGQGSLPVSEAGGTITTSAPCTPTTPPGGASNTPPPRPSSAGSAARRTTHPAALADSSNATAGNLHHPVPPARGVAPGNEVVLALLGYNVTVLIGIVPELGRIVGDFSTAAQVAYGVVAMLAAALLPITSMAAVINHHSVSAFCAKLGAIVCSDLLVVAISTRFGRWGGVAAAPSAAAVTFVMTAMWIRGDEHGIGKAISASWRRVVRLFSLPEPGEIAIAGRQPVTNDPHTAINEV